MLTEEVDYLQNAIRGVSCMVIATIIFTVQTSVVKWGSFIGYTASITLIFRGIIQLIFCFIEASILFDKNTKSFRCSLRNFLNDVRSIGNIKSNIRIPIFQHNQRSQDYGTLTSYNSIPSLSSLAPLMTTSLSANSNIQQQNLKNNNNIQQKQNLKQNKQKTNYKVILWCAIVLRGVLGGIGTLLLFRASILLPVGDVQAVISLTAIITPIFAFLCFKDVFTKLHFISIIGAVIGIILIVQPPFIFKNAPIKTSTYSNGEVLILGYTFAISRCVTQSFVYICIQFTRKVPIYILTMSQSIGSIITGFVALFAFETFTNTMWMNRNIDIAYIVILGVVGYVYLWLLTMSARYISSGVIALLLNLSIVWGYLTQIFIFHQLPTWITIIGAICMFLSATIVSMDKLHEAKKKSVLSMSVIQRNVAVEAGV